MFLFNFMVFYYELGNNNVKLFLRGLQTVRSKAVDC